MNQFLNITEIYLCSRTRNDLAKTRPIWEGWRGRGVNLFVYTSLEVRMTLLLLFIGKCLWRVSRAFEVDIIIPGIHDGFSRNFLCRFPVMSVVSLPNGTVVSKMNANDLMERQSGEEM